MELFSRNKPKIKVQTSKKDGFSGWLKSRTAMNLSTPMNLNAILTAALNVITTIVYPPMHA